MRRLRALALIVIFVGGLIAILLGIRNGWFTIQAGRFTISLLGAILIGKVIVQQTFAYLNNRRWKKRLRGRILDEVQKIREIDRNSFEKLYWMRYPEWIELLWEWHNLKAIWPTIMQSMVQTAAEKANRPVPKIGIEIPIHGVELQQVQDTVASILLQTVPVDHVVLALNGHQGTPLEQQVIDYVASLNDERVTYISITDAHKRTAMARGYEELDRLGCEESSNADADTKLHEDVNGIGLTAKLIDPKVHGITTNVEIETPYRDRLSFDTWLRYLYANLVERAAQSWFYCVSCMSGPYMQCRTQDIRIILTTMKRRWEEQEFWRRRVGPGDDRTLTECLLSLGLGTVFICDMHTFTECPSTLRKWIKQQTRWGRSGYRGFIVKVVEWWFWERFAVLTILDEWYLATFSFLLMIVVGQITKRTIDVIWTQGLASAGTYILPYLIIVIVVNVLRAALMALINHDIRHLQSVWYIRWQIRYLIWIKVFALATVTNSDWGTRTADPPTPPTT